jgi:hypothetical protein
MPTRNMMKAVADGVNAEELIRVVVREAVKVNPSGMGANVVAQFAALSNGNVFAEAYAANYDDKHRYAAAVGAAIFAYVANPAALEQIFEIALRAIAQGKG